MTPVLPNHEVSVDPVPLVVDLDDTLLRTDSTLEALFLFVRQDPLAALMLPWRLLRGRAYLKQYLAQRALLDVKALPYRHELLAYLKAQKQRGRRVVLATGADRAVAGRVAQELGVFDLVFASDGIHNLNGERKRARLVAEFGEKGFDYVGDSRREDAVWRSARQALLADPTPRIARRVARTTQLAHTFDDRPVRLRTYLRALRPHHWVKNVLVFLPLMLAHRLYEPHLLVQGLLAFVAFSLCASGVYLLNDLMDLPFDRAHPQKKDRALPSGQIRLVHALALAPLLLTGALLVALALPAAFLATLSAYFVLMMIYSIRLKDVPILDGLTLALGYASRVAAGSIVLGLAPSIWLLAFCVLLFMSLALIKRYTELLTMESVSGAEAHARGYLPNDRGIMAAQGIASGYLAVLILALYTNTNAMSPATGREASFWSICLLLFYWINYMWLTAQRGRMHHDPVAFALTDRVSQIVIAAMAVAAVYAL